MKKIKIMPIIIFLCIIMIIGFSPFVYAEFTKQYNPRVPDFGITISSQDNMLISSNGSVGTFKDYINYTELISNKEFPLTPLVGKVTDASESEEFKAVHFDLLDTLGNEASTDKYYAFDLYFLGNRDMNLYLAGDTTGTLMTFDKDSTVNGSFSEEQKTLLSNQLRVAILTYGTTYQGNEPGYTTSPIAVNIYSKTGESTQNYDTFNKLGYNNASDDTLLANTKKEEITKVRVVIWLENDESLVGLDAMCRLTLSLRFQAVPIEN